MNHQEVFLGCRVERAAADTLEAYRLISPDGTVVRLLRITSLPALLYAVDRTDHFCMLRGHVLFTDQDGTLAVVI
jgi:hypothetical protein